MGLTDEQVWPAHTARHLTAHLGRPVRYVLAAIPGWSSVQGVRLYRDLVAESDYDFVVFWFGMNDAKEIAGGIPDSWYRSKSPPLKGGSSFLSRLRVVQLVRFVLYRFGSREDLIVSPPRNSRPGSIC